jgi:glycosyltransferase involved in cell wall biosynthesis
MKKIAEAPRKTSCAVIVSTFNQPQLLDRCLFALDRQSTPPVEIVIADDGSGDETRTVIEGFARQSGLRLRHVWHENRGFRKTRILSKAIHATEADYLVFTDGDCVPHPDFIAEHLANAAAGHYLNGSLIRLNAAASERITREAIVNGTPFEAGWLIRNGGRIDRRYLRLALDHRSRSWLNRHNRTPLYWLGSNSSCFRADAIAVNGFDNRFSYGFEDGDFGNRLENFGLTPRTVRWTAILLHLWHERPWARPDVIERNQRLVTPKGPGNRQWAEDGLREAVADDWPQPLSVTG